MVCRERTAKGRRATIRIQPIRRSGFVLVIALLAAAGAAVPACAQSMLPAGTQPARSVPAKVLSPGQPPAVEPRPVLQNVTILRRQTSVEVRIETSGPVNPVAMTLSQPERIVVDLPNVGYDDSRCFAVNAGDVQGVRVAMFRFDPPVARVVVDLAHQRKYRLLSASSRVILVIDTSAKPVIAAPPAAAQVATVAAPSSAPPAAAAPADHPPVSMSASEAKLQPLLVAPPEAPAQPPAQPAPIPAAQPPEPAVSTALLQVATPAVPSYTAPLSAAAEEEGTTPHQAAKGNKLGMVSSVTVLRGKDAIEVHIEGTKPLRASASTLNKPERIIIDLADARLERPRHIPVNAADVQAVDCSLYLVNPPVARVVVNLTHAHPYHLLAYGSSLIVRIETEAVQMAEHPAR